MTHVNKLIPDPRDDSSAETLSAMSEVNGPRASLKPSLRWGVALPLAGIITLALGITMASLISDEFTPQNKGEFINASINPVVEDIVDTISIEPPERQNEIDIPPPPPKVSHAATDRVIIAPVSTKVITLDINLDDLQTPRNTRLNIDTGYQPILRGVPIFPSRAERSGHCKVQFDVSPQGQPFNIKAVFCTEKLFERSTIKSVEKWKYRPKTEGGQAITVKNVKNTVRFNLTDERGRMIPE